MTAINWLHISDLHFCESQAYDSNVVLQALLRDVNKRRGVASNLAHLDFIFVTGDCAFSAQPHEHALATRFLKDVLIATKVPKDRLFVVPANHDVDWAAIRIPLQAQIDALSDRGQAYDMFANATLWATVISRFHCYQDFANAFLKMRTPLGASHYSYVQSCNVSRRKVAILGLNSAWASATDVARDNYCSVNAKCGRRSTRPSLPICG